MIAPYTVQTGLPDKHKAQLLEFTKSDPEIQKQTTDWQTVGGRPGRFSSKAALDTWLKGGKEIYTLVDEKGNLAGILWFTSKIVDQAKYPEVTALQRAQYQTTFGIRLYGEARGHKLATPFFQEALRLFIVKLGVASVPLWIEVKAENERGLHLYQKWGFTPVTKSRTGGQILLTAILPTKD